MGAQVAKNPNCLVRSHVDAAEGCRMISANRQQGDLRRAGLPNFLETVEISAVAGVVNPAALVLQHEAAVTPMMISERAGSPVFARGQRHLPTGVREAFPPFQFDHAPET